jgi:YD repeat-containing protein
MPFVDDGISSPPGNVIGKADAGVPVSGPNPVTSQPAAGMHVIVDGGSVGGGGTSLGLANSTWYDPASPTVFYIRRELDNNGTFTITWENLDGTPATPTVANLRPGSGNLGNPISIANTTWYDPAAPSVFYIRRELDNNGTFTVIWENLDGTGASPTLANLRPFIAQAAPLTDSAGNAFNPENYPQTMTYNAAGAIATASVTDGTNTWTQTFGYDANGRPTSISKWVKS